MTAEVRPQLGAEVTGFQWAQTEPAAIGVCLDGDPTDAGSTVRPAPARAPRTPRQVETRAESKK